MKIPALDLKKQTLPIRKKLDRAIKGVIDSNSFIMGEGVARFEKHAAGYAGVKYALGVSNGTDAISLALLALGIGPGDEVICPAFTYYATAGAVAAIGARPVFADIESDTYNISLKSIEEALKKIGNKVKAVIPVHLYGLCAEMDGILKLARKYKIKVVEDAAQAFGSEYKGKKAGSLGDCGAVSFYPGKNLGAFGDAGMCLTNSKTLAGRIDLFRNQGNKDRYYHLILGRNNRMDTIQAEVLDIKLKYLDRWNGARLKIARRYGEGLEGSGLKLPAAPKDSVHIYHQYTLSGPVSNRSFASYLNSKGIDSRIFYPVPLHLQACFGYLGYKAGDFPNAEEASKKVFTLPVYPELTEKEQDYIIRTVKAGILNFKN
ncbi:MAG: DegT/DnrJ/EryC1/StrS family aminotransferase [Candidatus Omnitrophica bacterium]|jgi:dTDP-4-amino-4,6-dideoxygalactose transaminase|nr:DegT/DnrJ/EryC1/StrS family aminotransferase [Candidatus Omnitrophota bacterium]